jgi:hypothetical protein
MRIPRPTGPACALVLAVVLGAAAHGQDATDVPLTDPDPSAEQEFPWLCFATTVAALGGLAVLVYRAARKAGPGGPGTWWYCRACDRDVSGPECPHCRAPNVFVHDQEVGRSAGDVRGTRQRYD